MYKIKHTVNKVTGEWQPIGDNMYIRKLSDGSLQIAEYIFKEKGKHK